MLTATCERCGFQAADYSARDLATASLWLDAMVDQTIDGADADVVAAPPVAATVGSLQTAIDGLGESDPDTVHECLHLLRLLGRQLHDAGAGAPTQTGTLAQINTSDGGVPKGAMASADVGPRGVLGDRQANRTHHGRPFQALCLWSTEIIDALRAEGHPVYAGAAGENLTVSGVDWSTLRPGVRLLVGEVLCELSVWATPCRKNDQWFIGRSDRIDHELHPGWSRVYAWVLEPGTVRTGDAVTVEP